MFDIIKHNPFTATVTKHGEPVIHLSRVAMESALSQSEWETFLKRVMGATSGYSVTRIWHGWVVAGQTYGTLDEAVHACEVTHKALEKRWTDANAAACRLELEVMKNGETITVYPK